MCWISQLQIFQPKMGISISIFLFERCRRMKWRPKLLFQQEFIFFPQWPKQKFSLLLLGRLTLISIRTKQTLNTYSAIGQMCYIPSVQKSFGMVALLINTLYLQECFKSITTERLQTTTLKANTIVVYTARNYVMKFFEQSSLLPH